MLLFRLEALDPDAYTAFQASRDLERVVTKVLENRGGPSGLKKALSVGIQLGVPVLPMLVSTVFDFLSSISSRY